MRISQRTEQTGKKSCRGTVKKCTLTRRRREKCKKTELNTSKRKGDQQFTVDGRTAEITVDLLLQARAQMCDSKLNGPGDAVVSEMIKQLALEKSRQLRSVFKNAPWVRWRGQVRGRL